MTAPAPDPWLSLDGHSAIVIGANHGIGAATARTLAARGARVALAYLLSDAARLITANDVHLR